MEYPSIITNMAFWQSPLWLSQTDSIHPLNPTGRAPPAMSPLREAWRLYRRRADYDIVLTLGMRESMLYGLFCALTGTPSKQIMTEIFIDQEQPEQWLWRLKTGLYSWIARRTIGIITNSSQEVRTIAARFSLPEDRLQFVPLNATIPPEESTETSPPYVLAAGRTLRDYDLLINAAQELDAAIVIICGPDDLPATASPDNVTVLREVGRETYLDYLRKCAVVALPLLRTDRSTGQVVMLEAMALGKPVIATRSPGTVDHIRNGENGFLIEVDDVHGFVQRIRALLDDPALRRRCGDAARDDMRRAHMPDHHAKAKLEAIRTLLERNSLA